MNADKIKSEILKESPNWLLISELAKEQYESQLETNTLGFKKGVLNIIKVGEWDIYDIHKEISACFDNEEYHYITNDDVRKFNKWIKSKPDLFDRYHMIQLETICISEPHIPSEYEIAKHSLFIMESNVHRMKYMMDLGYFCNEYSEDEWQKFKKVEVLLRNRHSNVEYHTKNKT